MYLLIRITLLAIMLIALLFILYKKKIKLTKIKIAIIIAVSIILLVLLNIFSIENIFLKFDTIKDSYAYLGIRDNILQIIEEDDCAFIISGNSLNSTTLHTVTKYGNQWGMVDADAELNLYRSNPSKSQNGKSFVSAVIYNKECNKSFVKLSGTFIDEKDENFTVENENQNEYEIIGKEHKLNITVVFYYRIEEYQFKDQFLINTKNEEIVLCKSSLFI